MKARNYLQSLPEKPRVPWDKLFYKADPKGTATFIYHWYGDELTAQRVVLSKPHGTDKFRLLDNREKKKNIK